MNNMNPAPTCKKVKNPCKICLQEVKALNGVQCSGACEAWVHFECLYYTPGKIKDIKDGHIIITCPCPDCKTVVPKEHVKEEPFTCNNVACPANNPPACEEFHCQANELSRSKPPRLPPNGTLRTCDPNLCRDYAGPTAFKSLPEECLEGYIVATRDEPNVKMRVQMPDGRIVCNPNDECPQNMKTATTGTQAQFPGQGGNLQQGQGGNLQQGQGGNLQQGQGGNLQQGQGQNMFSPAAVQQMCRNVGELAQQLNVLMDSLKGMAGNGLPGGEGQGMMPCGSSGSNCAGKAGCNKCKDVGQGQPQKPGCGGGCGQAGQPGCARPCRCPGNPAKKHR